MLIGVGVQREEHVAKSLRYCMVHTITKYDIDPTPFFSGNFVVPEKVLKEAQSSRSKLMQKMADPEEVKVFLFNNPQIKSWGDFSSVVDTAFEAAPDSIPLSRLSQFLSKTGGRDGKKTVRAILDRRENFKYRADDDKSYKDFLMEAHAAKCTCPVRNGLRNAYIRTVKWHDENEYVFRHSKSLFGDFAEAMCDGHFSDRCQTIYLVGVSGTGKSSVLNAFLNVVPDRRVFHPVYGSSAPFANLRPYHIIGNYQEFRVSPKMEPNTLLLMLERAENVPFDVKGESSLSIPRGPRNIMSSNYLKPRDNWMQEDIDAILDRVKTGTWTRKLPIEFRENSPVNVLECKCKKCSIAFLCWCSPALARKLRTDGKQGDTNYPPSQPLKEDRKQKTPYSTPSPPQMPPAPIPPFNDYQELDYPEEFSGWAGGFDEP